MVNRSGDRFSAFAKRAQGHDAAAQQAGINEVFGRIAELGPQVLTLQTALLDGLVRGQRREAKRLARKDENDPRVAAAARRAERASDLHDELARFGDVAMRLAEGLEGKPLFHGYVLDAEGEPAVGHVVRIGGDKLERYAHIARHAAETDAAGYFRFDFGMPKPRSTVRMQQRGEAASVQDEALTAAQVEVEVEVLDPKGAVVFRDPSPPDLGAGDTVFRFYPLIAAGGAAGTAFR